MEIGEKDIENLLVNIILEKNNFKKTHVWKDYFHALLSKNMLNNFHFGGVQVYNL
jgi:hypothetical protein